MTGKKSMKPSNARKVAGRLLQYMMMSRRSLIVVCFCIIVSAFCSARGTAYLMPAINDYILPLVGHKNPDLSGFFRILGKMTALYVLGAAAAWLQGRIMVNVSQETLFRIRTELFAAMQKKALSDFGTYAQGHMISLFSNDVNAMSNMLRQSFPRIVNDSMTCLFIMVTMFLMNWQLAATVLLCDAVLVLFLKRIVRKNIGHFSSQQKEMSNLSACAEEYIAGRYTVKAFGQEKLSCDKFRAFSGKLFSSSVKSAYYSDAIFNLTTGLSNIGFTLVAVAGVALTMLGAADVGTVGTILQYYRSLYNPLTGMSKQLNNFFSALAGAERVFQFLDSPGEMDDGTVRLTKDGNSLLWEIPEADGKTRLKPFHGYIRFEHVCFGYQPGTDVLHDLTLVILPGRKTAFVGSTGAGKTTVINLISRFYEIRSGIITCDGINIRDIRKDDLRAAAGVVLQEVNLFTGTLADNIRFGCENANIEKIQNAAQTVQADKFIRQLPNEYDSFITNNGESLGQGHKQLLSLARTAAVEAPILILDEATSSVDTYTEALINKGLDALMENRTVLVIAHRLSTIENADQIIVLDNGCIAEKGTYQTLIAQKGLFWRLSQVNANIMINRLK